MMCYDIGGACLPDAAAARPSGGARKGTNGVSTNGGHCNFHVF